MFVRASILPQSGHGALALFGLLRQSFQPYCCFERCLGRLGPSHSVARRFAHRPRLLRRGYGPLSPPRFCFANRVAPVARLAPRVDGTLREVQNLAKLEFGPTALFSSSSSSSLKTSRTPRGNHPVQRSTKS
uniref:Secreted protein n=1 Tax=Macrostomum lignano TaxID=282301 RepID=A0A1I8H7X5_9PLAT